MFQSGLKKAEYLGGKEEPYCYSVEVDNCICSILYYQINLGNNFFHNLLDYGNEYIQNLSIEEDIAQHSLLVFDSSTHVKLKSREEFDT